jgi:hypothetical protein
MWCSANSASSASPRPERQDKQWEHGGGFSLNAAVRIEATDRKGLERLLRYCARLIFASERLEWVTPGQRLLSSP